MTVCDYTCMNPTICSLQGLAGDLQGAVKTCKHAVSINDLDATAYYNLGCALDNVGDSQGAMDQFSR